MDLERERRLHELLMAALEQPSAERRSFLENSCQDDPELLAEVLSTLDQEWVASSLFERPALQELTPASAAALSEVTPTIRGSFDSAFVQLPSFTAGVPKDPIGPFRPIEMLGTGGMGQVFLAEQTEPVERRVALKVVRDSIVSTELRARFATERRALARLSHPNIGQMFEAGTTDEGFPYFAMEYVPGPPITEYSDDKYLTVEQRLELFLAVCAGVQHAHKKRILHRDLKPSNVLVTEIDGEPVPKIIDFGIAKALDRSSGGFTPLTGERIIGTPSYLSPEALRITDGQGEIDQRTDVYALGVLLYELLIGDHPFETQGAGMAEVMRRITEDEALSPSARLASRRETVQMTVAERRGVTVRGLSKRLRGDLDGIASKAVERDRKLRYGSVEELASDIRRHLRHEEISVSSEGLGPRASRLLRRNRQQLAAAVVILSLLTIGIIGTFLGLLQARRAERMARSEAERASRQAAAAFDARIEAEAAMDFMVDLFRASDPNNRRQRAVRPLEEITARELLDQASERLESGELGDRPLVRARLSGILGRLHSQLGQYDLARRFLERTLALRREHLPPGHHRIAETHLELSLLASTLSDLETAEDHVRQALASWQDDPTRTLEKANALDQLGRLRSMAGDYDAAEPLIRQGLELREETLGEDHSDVGQSLNNLAVHFFRQGRFEEAETLFDRCLEIHRQHLDPGHPQLIQSLNNLAASRASQGRLEEARPVFEEALEQRREVFGNRHPAVAESLNNLAVLYTDLEQPQRAEALHREALAIRTEAFGEQHPLVAWSLENLGETVADQDRLAEAEQHHLKALSVRETTLGAEHPEVARSLSDLGQLARRQDRLAAAGELLGRALAIRQAAFSEPNQSLVNTRLQLAEVRRRQGELDSTVELLTEALRELEALAGDDSPRLAEPLVELAEALLDQGRREQAQTHLQRALPLLQDGDATLARRAQQLLDRASSFAAAG